MDELEKEALVDEVLTRINEMTDQDKKQKSIENRKAMMGLCDYINEKVKEYGKNHPYDAKGDHVDLPHLWKAIYHIKTLVPWYVSVRYSNEENWDAFYEANPGAERRTCLVSVPNQLLKEDSELACAIGKELIDILFKYLEPDSWDEEKKGKERSAKNKRSPMTKIRGWR